jgi:hypothetical protein
MVGLTAECHFGNSKTIGALNLVLSNGGRFLWLAIRVLTKCNRNFISLQNLFPGRNLRDRILAQIEPAIATFSGHGYRASLGAAEEVR